MQVVVKYSEFDNELGAQVPRTFRVELLDSTKEAFATFKFGSPDERCRRAEEDSTRAVADEVDDEDGDGADADVFEEVDELGRTLNRVNAPTLAAFRQIKHKLDTGALPPYSTWQNKTVYPPDFSIVEPFSVVAADVLPIYFHNPPEFYRRTGAFEEGCPCLRCGWAHASHVRIHGFKEPRLAKDGQ